MADESYTHKYIYKTAREKNLFLEEYYSGTDTNVFFDDDKQTQISYISYSLDEQLKPVYGYASRTFDDMVVGARIVTGTIKVPIYNIEEQSTDEEVMAEPTTEEEIEKANSIQEDNIKKTSWTNNPGKDKSGSDNNGMPEDIVPLLQNEGYNIAEDDSDDNKQSIIDDYKKRNNMRLDVSNEEVMKDLLKKQIKTNANVNSTNILMSPGGTDVKYTIQIGDSLQVEVLSGPYDSVAENGKQYTLVKYKDNNGQINTGFVDTEFIESLFVEGM